MTENVKLFLEALKSKEYRKNRIDVPYLEGLEKPDGSALWRTSLFTGLMEYEKPNILPGDIFGFNRTVKMLPFSYEGNMTPDYDYLLGRGFKSVEDEINLKLPSSEGKKREFYECCLKHISAISALCEAYRLKAEALGNIRLAEALKRVPSGAAETFYEALLFQKILIFVLRISGINHLTVGRFDQYMYPYFLNDVNQGKSKEELLEELELYFISLNVDSDIYNGVQQGDNGQSMVLGGFDAEGNDMFNPLSELCMEASLELCLIDPKINLRVGKKTPIERYEYATLLTKAGLGFPQYCNDDIVVPGLTALGYDYEDALNYTVAACWEFIVPRCALDIPNIETFNFPLIVNNAICENLRARDSFEQLLEAACGAIKAEAERITTLPKNGFYDYSSPMLAMVMRGCFDEGFDVSDKRVKYICFGCHGAGIANAADALSAVKRVIYEDKSVSKETLLCALAADFKGYSELRNLLLSCPKMGNNEDSVDNISCIIMDAFADNVNGKPNAYGGFWRAGTGSAMEYIRSAKACPATADGRRAFAPYSSSFSPAVTSKLSGPLSVIKSFTKYDLKKTINGGPLTLELHDAVFRNEQGIAKTAMLVKLFIDSGGHQLQLNAVNRERLLEAQAHPEDYPNLVVRVWGWSGYFCELDKEFQDHIISRTEFSV